MVYGVSMLPVKKETNRYCRSCVSSQLSINLHKDKLYSKLESAIYGRLPRKNKHRVTNPLIHVPRPNYLRDSESLFPTYTRARACTQKCPEERNLDFSVCVCVLERRVLPLCNIFSAVVADFVSQGVRVRRERERERALRKRETGVRGVEWPEEVP